jgi:type VI secretion system secreted protein Hcp
MAFDAFLKLDGIKGEGPAGEISLESFSWGVSNTSTIGSATGGAGSGKAMFQDFSFTSVAGAESADLFLAAAAGKHIQSGQLTVSDKSSSLITITFSDVLISSYKIDQMSLKIDSAGQSQLGAPTGRVSFNFAKFVFQTKGSSASGGPATDSIG